MIYTLVMAFLFTFLILGLVVGVAWRLNSETKAERETALQDVIKPDERVLKQETLLALYSEGQLQEGIIYFVNLDLKYRTPEICHLG